MRSLLQKSLFFGLGLFSVAVVAGSLISLPDVNQKIAALAAPFNNPTTTLSLKFTDLNVSADRALDFGMNALLAKKGAVNQLQFRIDKADYHYGDGTHPEVSANVSLNLDLVKAFGQETLDQLGGALSEISTSLISSSTEKYGAAASLDVAVDEMQKDPAGHIISAKMHVKIAIDPTQLPATLKPEDVEFSSTQLFLSVGTTGLQGQFVAVLNPQNKGFQPDQPGLKEFIEKILNQDPATYASIEKYVNFLDAVAQNLVDRRATQTQLQK